MPDQLDQYGVMGNPIAHSKSPFIHTEFARQTGQRLTYCAILVERGQFIEAVNQFKSQQGNGLNVTVPFKEEAWQLVDERSASAEKAGAVNTISITSAGRLIGDNTDGIGLVRDIQVNHGLALADKRILILGAGGAVRGILQPLLNTQPQSIVIANRTVSKAQLLVDLFGSQENNLQAVGFDAVASQFDVVINGTSASLQGELPPLAESNVNGAVCYDMMYGKEETVFLQWARKAKAEAVIDGLGMLVEQAAESFSIWRDVRPATQPVIDMLRKSF